jgi:hypothetical protein
LAAALLRSGCGWPFPAFSETALGTRTCPTYGRFLRLDFSNRRTLVFSIVCSIM